MLGPAYNWIEGETGCYLQHRYGTVAYVKPDPVGGFKVVIYRGDREIIGSAGSLAQGQKHVERWLSARGGMYEKRRLYRPSPELLRRWETTNRMARRLLKQL